MATICSCNNTTAASTPTSTPSSLVSSTCGTNCHLTQWGLHRSICSRTDSPPSRCVKPLYWTMFYQHFTMHCFYQFLLLSSIFTRILSLAHLFYAYFTHGPNKSASAQYDNTRGAWLTQEGCTITERKEGRKQVVSNMSTHIAYEYLWRWLNGIGKIITAGRVTALIHLCDCCLVYLYANTSIT